MKNLLLVFLFPLACGGSAPEAQVATTTASDDDLCLVHHFKGDYGAALRECTAACVASMKDSCKVLGDMFQRGEGVTQNATRADVLFAKACRLGNAQACSASAPPPPPPASVATNDEGGAHLSIGSIEADGVRLSDLSCDHVQGGVGGGIFGGIALAAGFKSRKAQLDACGAKSDAHVAWTGAGGTMTHVKATGASAGVNRCVERALDRAPSTITGSCSANVRVGN